MTTLSIRPYVGEERCYSLAVTDCGANCAKLFADIIDLVKLNDAIAQLDDDTLACDLQQFFDAPNVDRARDLRLWKDTNGKLIGFGQLVLVEENDEIAGYLYFEIHPTWRGKALEAEILEWSEQRLHQLGKQQGKPSKLHISCSEDRFTRLVLLERQGFTRERSFLTMACSLNQPFSSPSLPPGFTLRRCFDDSSNIPLPELRAWVELFNESFIDHWGNFKLTVDTARHYLKNSCYNPELNVVATAPDGTFAAFCVGYINAEENTPSDRNEGWIKLLGTRRGFRKLGLGRAMLLTAMQQLKAAGVEQVKLGVDAQSLTSATRLYESVGFQPIKSWLSYVKNLRE